MRNEKKNTHTHYKLRTFGVAVFAMMELKRDIKSIFLKSNLTRLQQL